MLAILPLNYVIHTPCRLFVSNRRRIQIRFDEKSEFYDFIFSFGIGLQEKCYFYGIRATYMEGATSGAQPASLIYHERFILSSVRLLSDSDSRWRMSRDRWKGGSVSLPTFIIESPRGRIQCELRQCIMYITRQRSLYSVLMFYVLSVFMYIEEDAVDRQRTKLELERSGRKKERRENGMGDKRMWFLWSHASHECVFFRSCCCSVFSFVFLSFSFSSSLVRECVWTEKARKNWKKEELRSIDCVVLLCRGSISFRVAYL